MISADDGLPEVGKTGRYLGARPRGKFRDFKNELDEDDTVRPGDGGMSVSPPPPTNLPRLVRPPEYGGKGKDPLWELETDQLPTELTYRDDPRPEWYGKHGFIEAAQDMSFRAYQEALHGTRNLWRRA